MWTSLWTFYISSWKRFWSLTKNGSSFWERRYHDGLWSVWLIVHLPLAFLVAANFAILTTLAIFALTILLSPALLRMANIKRSGYAGLHFDPITWNFFFRPIIAAIIGFGAAIGAKLAVAIALLFVSFVVNLLGATPKTLDNPLNWWMTLSLGAVLFLIGLLVRDGSDEAADGVVLEVPETKKAGLLLWNGMPAPFGITIYLWTGKYPWIGEKLGFSLSDFGTRVEDGEANVLESFTDGSYFNMGLIPFNVWNDSKAEEGSSDRSRITAPASNNATVETAITLIFEIVNPKLLTDSTDPGLDVGDRARQEWREFTINFIDTDLPKLHDVIDRVYLGAPLITCFLSESVSGLKPGSMIRSQAGRALFEVAEDGNVQAAEERLREQIEALAPPKLITDVSKDGDLQFTKVQVQHPINEVLVDNGLKLKRISFADIELSQSVTDASNEASAQEAERLTQIANAKAAKAARKELQPDEGEVRDELAMTLGAALDPSNKGNVRVIMAPGGNALTGAAIVGASEVSKG